MGDELQLYAFAARKYSTAAFGMFRLKTVTYSKLRTIAVRARLCDA